MVKFTSFVKYNDKFEQNHDNYAFKNINSKQKFHAFLFNIRNYSPEVSNIQQREAELNIILPKANKLILNKNRCGIFVLLYTPPIPPIPPPPPPTHTKQNIG